MYEAKVGRPQPDRGVRPGHARPTDRAHRGHQRVPRGPRTRRVPPAVPARARPRLHGRLRLRGPRPVGPSRRSATSRRRPSSPWPRRPASSWRSAGGSCSRPPGSWPSGRASSDQPLRMAVNLSRRQLTSPELDRRRPAGIAGHSGLAPSQLAPRDHRERAHGRSRNGPPSPCAELRTLGIAIAVDDFGTGYSSLSYLQRFPVDVLKIDRAFVEPLNRSEPASTALVSTIIGLARTMELDIVAEGIERPDQLDRLVELGCSKGQGFLMSRPLGPRRRRRLPRRPPRRAGGAHPLNVVPSPRRRPHGTRRLTSA